MPRGSKTNKRRKTNKPASGSSPPQLSTKLQRPFEHAARALRGRVATAGTAGVESQDHATVVAAEPPPRGVASIKGVTERESELFAMHMAGVAPLKPRGEKTPVLVTSSAAEATPAQLHQQARLLAAPSFEVSDDGTFVDGRRLDVDPRVLGALRRVLPTIDGELDLHGLRAAEARERVGNYIAKRAREGDQHLLIVTGKGKHSAAGAILRGEIAAWLSQGESARYVLAFTSEHKHPAGAGAVLVMLVS